MEHSLAKPPKLLAKVAEWRGSLKHAWNWHRERCVSQRQECCRGKIGGISEQEGNCSGNMHWLFKNICLLCLAFKCTSEVFVLFTVSLHMLKVNRKNTYLDAYNRDTNQSVPPSALYFTSISSSSPCQCSCPYSRRRMGGVLRPLLLWGALHGMALSCLSHQRKGHFMHHSEGGCPSSWRSGQELLHSRVFGHHHVLWWRLSKLRQIPTVGSGWMNLRMPIFAICRKEIMSMMFYAVGIYTCLA